MQGSQREVEAPLVSLTFDNGPTPGVTDRVLDLLGERGVRATFFVVGERLGQPGGSDLARRALAEGHQVGAHTMTHQVLLGQADCQADGQAAQAEVGAVETGDRAGARATLIEVELAGPDALLDGLGATGRLFRPYGRGGVLDRRTLSHEAVDYLLERRSTCVLWNSVPHDWDDPDGWVARALADVDAHRWTVPVLHDLPTGAMDHLAAFLDGLDDRGAEYRLDFPRDCVPILRGRQTADMAHLLPRRRKELL